MIQWDLSPDDNYLIPHRAGGEARGLCRTAIAILLFGFGPGAWKREQLNYASFCPLAPCMTTKTQCTNRFVLLAWITHGNCSETSMVITTQTLE